MSAKCNEYIVKNLNELEYESLEDAKVACDNFNYENQECNMIEHVDRRCDQDPNWPDPEKGKLGLEYRWIWDDNTKHGRMEWVPPKYKLCKTTSKLISWPYACLHIAGQCSISERLGFIKYGYFTSF